MTNASSDFRYENFSKYIHDKATLYVNIIEDLKTQKLNISGEIRQGDKEKKFPLNSSYFNPRRCLKQLNWEHKELNVDVDYLRHQTHTYILIY